MSRFDNYTLSASDFKHSDPDVLEVRMLNSENQTHYYQYLRKHRLMAFYEFIMNKRDQQIGVSTPTMPGMSGRAMAGLDAIFYRRPLKFPYLDIFNWLRDNQKEYLGYYPSPTITVQEIEQSLERFSDVYPPDVSER